MPNHCENDLYINAPSEEKLAELLTFIGANKEPPEFDFNVLIPYPEDLLQRDEDYEKLGRDEFKKKYGNDATDGFNSGGYGWCISNWGTKWGAYHVQEWDGKKLTFDTAWSPPAPQVLGTLHKKFPDCDLQLEYFEGGCGFCGGYGFRAKDCSDLGDDWKPGVMERDWSGNYQGSRGG